MAAAPRPRHWGFIVHAAPARMQRPRTRGGAAALARYRSCATETRRATLARRKRGSRRPRDACATETRLPPCARRLRDGTRPPRDGCATCAAAADGARRGWGATPRTVARLARDLEIRRGGDVACRLHFVLACGGRSFSAARSGRWDVLKKSRDPRSFEKERRRASRPRRRKTRPRPPPPTTRTIPPPP